MSYDIYLKDENGNTYETEPFFEGGIQLVRGCSETYLNITYNYSWYYYKYLDEKEGIRYLYGKRAEDCIGRLYNAINEFPDIAAYERDYWCPCPGNCSHALSILLSWCYKFPNGIFEGD